MKNIPVSVIIPCYNSSKTVERAYKSVAMQKLFPLEIIFVDDASTDDNLTVDIIKRIQKNDKNCDVVLIQQEKNKGPAAARNLGCSFAKGDYIAFLDSDDIWLEDKLKIQYGIMSKNPECILSCHPIERFDDSENESNREVHITRIKKWKELFKHKIFTSSVMIKNKENIRFDQKQKLSEDFLLWIQLLSKEGFYIHKTLANNFKKKYGESGLSADLSEMEKWELIALHKLYKQNNINLFEYCGASFFSLLKYILRILRLK